MNWMRRITPTVPRLRPPYTLRSFATTNSVRGPRIERLQKAHLQEEEEEEEDENRPSIITKDGVEDGDESSPVAKFNEGALQQRGYWQNRANHRKFFDWAAKKLNIRNVPDDWYSISRNHLYELGGAGLMTMYYDSSPRVALASVYPEIEWLPWRFKSGVPRGFWNDHANRVRFFEWVAKQLNVNKTEDWYNISREDVLSLGGAGMLNHCYGGSMYAALTDIYPEVDWLPWRFPGPVPTGYWRDEANQRKFFDWAAIELGIVKPEDWYRITTRDLERLGGRGLMETLGGSIIGALQQIYPHFEWLPWRFACGVPDGYWDDMDNQRRFFDWAATQLGITKHEDWYDKTRADVHKVGGVGLLRKHYGGSLSSALLKVYPEIEWLPWKFVFGVPDGYWSDMRNQRKFFDWAAKQLRINHIPEDWYKISREEVNKLGGSGLLKTCYTGSLIQALCAVYPDAKWQQWRFKHFHITDAVSGTDVVRSFIDFLSQELCIRNLDEWHRVSARQLRRFGGSNLVAYHGGLFVVLKQMYPEHNWDERRFHLARGKKASQRWLRVGLSQLFPLEEIIEEFDHPSLYWGTDSTNTMTLDLWIPSRSLAFEYHGAQHFHDVNLFGNPTMVQQRDAERIAACKKAGITLIIVPYWWDGAVDNLAATIAAARPDLASPGSPLALAAANGVPLLPHESAPRSSG